jgi:hypothetical protein
MAMEEIVAYIINKECPGIVRVKGHISPENPDEFITNGQGADVHFSGAGVHWHLSLADALELTADARLREIRYLNGRIQEMTNRIGELQSSSPNLITDWNGGR